MLLADFDHLQASLLKKEPNDLFFHFSSKKLLTVLAQIRIMRPVPNETATNRKGTENMVLAT
ncbi:hypothetical protein DZ860_09610 [Vibrio sinensis]|uniref:Uncharacterized protein n=1 Tax=Vibrio sinensis TaxID=2302434 RepID=A0A3A6QTL2_9VIBR|nr:hypothetical protein DZ860_09610 [Vibrio sinensis]